MDVATTGQGEITTKGGLLIKDSSNNEQAKYSSAGQIYMRKVTFVVVMQWVLLKHRLVLQVSL